MIQFKSKNTKQYPSNSYFSIHTLCNKFECLSDKSKCLRPY